ncbi:MAG: hypothetical protein MJY44_04675 [Bacteroidales bacterium]|nr:hypothetical protein [Bacteroidales bacterium]
MLEGIRTNIERLIALYEKQKKRSDELSLALGQKEVELENCRRQIADLKREVAGLQLSGAFASPAVQADSKERLRKLVAEIDRCIELLES